MQRLILFLFISVPILGCSAPVKHNTAISRPISQVAPAVTAEKAAAKAEAVVLTKKQVIAVKDAVRRRLKDPESAKFGSMTASTEDRVQIFVCGWVNAKNSYGGYTGDEPFYAVHSTKTGYAAAGAVGGTPNEQAAILSVCASGGAPLQ